MKRILKLYHEQVQGALDTMSIFHSPFLKEWDAQCYCLAVQFFIGLVTDKDEVVTFENVKDTPSSLLSQCQQTCVITPCLLPSDKIKPSLLELAWWIERGILQTRRFTGTCTRKLRCKGD